ncbi:hypothetical protein ABID42_000561 [Arcicella rosea]|uniref:hypothetical protein n=1 Tax=Arcicella rosea TaxID=502909 RepID=UPI00345D1A05
MENVLNTYESISLEKDFENLLQSIEETDVAKTSLVVDNVNSQYKSITEGRGGVRLVMRTYNSLEKDIY